MFFIRARGYFSVEIVGELDEEWVKGALVSGEVPRPRIHPADAVQGRSRRHATPPPLAWQARRAIFGSLVKLIWQSRTANLATRGELSTANLSTASAATSLAT